MAKHGTSTRTDLFETRSGDMALAPTERTKALQQLQTLLTEAMATGLTHLLADLGPYAMLGALFAITAAAGLFISNTATAVFMAPVAIGAAQDPGGVAARVRHYRRSSLLLRFRHARVLAGEHFGPGARTLRLHRLP